MTMDSSQCTHPLLRLIAFTKLGPSLTFPQTPMGCKCHPRALATGSGWRIPALSTPHQALCPPLFPALAPALLATSGTGLVLSSHCLQNAKLPAASCFCTKLATFNSSACHWQLLCCSARLSALQRLTHSMLLETPGSITQHWPCPGP